MYKEFLKECYFWTELSPKYLLKLFERWLEDMQLPEEDRLGIERLFQIIDKD